MHHVLILIYDKVNVLPGGVERIEKQGRMWLANNRHRVFYRCSASRGGGVVAFSGAKTLQGATQASAYS